MGVFPRYPRAHAAVENVGQKHVETNWEGDSELDAREAHEAEVAIGIEARAIRVEELLDHDSTFEKGAEREESVDDGDEGEYGNPHPVKCYANWGIVSRDLTTDALDDVRAVALIDVV